MFNVQFVIMLLTKHFSFFGWKSLNMTKINWINFYSFRIDSNFYDYSGQLTPTTPPDCRSQVFLLCLVDGAADFRVVFALSRVWMWPDYSRLHVNIPYNGLNSKISVKMLIF